LTYFVTKSVHQKHVDTYLHSSLQNNIKLYNVIYEQFKEKSQLIYYNLLKDKFIIDIYEKLQKADETQKNILRQKLYNYIKNDYKVYKKNFSIEQLHFHLSNNESFLRAHKVDKYGDNLSDIRKTIQYVNENFIPVDGFEIGRVYSGLRFVYPIKDNQEKHLGSVEVSFNIKLFIKEFMEKFDEQSNFHLSQKIVDLKIWEEMRRHYYIDSPINGFYIEQAISTQNEVEPYNKETLEEINSKISQNERNFAIYSDDLKKVLIFIAINNPLTNKTIGYLSIRSDSKDIQDSNKNFYIFFITTTLFMLAIAYIFYIRTKRQLLARQELEEKVQEKTKELEKEKQSALDASKAKSDFLANMSHEIRTPLNSIIGFIDILRENEKDEENKQHLDIVKSSSESLLGIINDILDFNKIESHKIELEEISFDVKKLFKDIGMLYYDKASEKNINFLVNIDENTPKNILGDPLRLKQIIINLTYNAIKFTSNGGKIELYLRYNKENSKIRIGVKDNGIGISKENIKKVFQPFTQEDTSTTRRFGGTGLGISISSNLVTLMGGELKVISEVSKGSEFYFSIPLKEAKETLNSEEKQTDDAEIDFSNKKVLLVEDNQANQMFMKVMFKKLNLEYDIAGDGIEAIEMFTKSKYDFILMDENMPNMNGIEATKNIRKYERKHGFQRTPIIALTANALKGDREKFLKAEMDEYMSKPFNKKKFLTILKKIIH
jgi:signal transduction histidine kinase/CheY-like chemotaxis protein